VVLIDSEPTTPTVWPRMPTSALIENEVVPVAVRISRNVPLVNAKPSMVRDVAPRVRVLVPLFEMLPVTASAVPIPGMVAVPANVDVIVGVAVALVWATARVNVPLMDAVPNGTLFASAEREPEIPVLAIVT
jgi:hypothetical protein